MSDFHSRISAILGMCPRCHVDPCECDKHRKADASQLLQELNSRLGKSVGLPEAKFRPTGSAAIASARAADISAQTAVKSATISASAATSSATDATSSATDATSPAIYAGYPPGGFVSHPKYGVASITADRFVTAKAAPELKPKLPKDEFIPSWDREEDMPELEEIDDLPEPDAPDEKLSKAVETVRKHLADEVHHSIISNNFVLADKLMSMTAMEVFERYSEGSTT